MVELKGLLLVGTTVVKMADMRALRLVENWASYWVVQKELTLGAQMAAMMAVPKVVWKVD